MTVRDDADAMSKALAGFRARSKSRVSWWTEFAYHYTDVRNAANIISERCLYCRETALTKGLMINDNANQEVISQSESAHRWVRLYFRPRTPTQYRNEGIRPRAFRGSGHCPVPVFFFFDLDCILRAEGSQFTPGGMNKKYEMPAIYSRPDELDSNLMPAREIYHYGAYNPEREGHIKDRRHAEILLPEPVDLDECLKWIVCRSPAEREALLCLIGSKNRKRYERLIRVGKGDLFERRWPYVESVDVSHTKSKDGTDVTRIAFHFFPESQQRSIFDYTARIKDLETGKNYSLTEKYDHGGNRPLLLYVRDVIKEIRVELLLEGDLAFAGERILKLVF